MESASAEPADPSAPPVTVASADPASPAGLGIIHLRSEPTDAQVLDADGLLLGRTPLRLERPRAPRQLVFRRPGYFDMPVSISRLTASELFAALTPASGAIVTAPAALFSCPPQRFFGRCEISPDLVGMAEAELLERLGPPTERRTGAWTYLFPPGCAEEVTTLRLRVVGGRVRSASASHEPTGIDCDEWMIP